MPHSVTTSSTCSSHGSSSTITFNTSECSTISTPRHRHPHQLSPPSSSPLGIHSDAAESKLSSPLDALLFSPSPERPRILKSPPDGHTSQAVKKSMGLMKLRRQGSHPPGINGTPLHQAAAARELMASLERLSVSKCNAAVPKLKNGTENIDAEAQRSLLEEGMEDEATDRVSKGGAQRLPLGAKIAAAMDAEGRIGVQKEIAERVEGMLKERELQVTTAADEPKMATKTRRKKKKRGLGRWTIRPKLRWTRTLFGKIWRNIKRLFSSSTKSHRGTKTLLCTTKN
ncbi:hypothetical protein GOP47_0005037 [Adiantum capillus-veneris]|uniref:Uncharacterized protein n=1 Tax=Adiantum capillus-veneris TaxID=13818 RepID=A0A9D4V4L8_ADICA|nr:hypothetical protein GOP47_0005037 [Adiantum capillus-veneris]